jgi:nuclear-control-of-ATPase protein 2
MGEGGTADDDTEVSAFLISSGSKSSSHRLVAWPAFQQILTVSTRNIDRVLVGATTNEYGEISYEDQGLLLLEVHRLRQATGDVLPRRIFYDLQEELNELAENRTGLERQLKIVERIRWAYAKWLR